MPLKINAERQSKRIAIILYRLNKLAAVEIVSDLRIDVLSDYRPQKGALFIHLSIYRFYIEF